MARRKARAYKVEYRTPTLAIGLAGSSISFVEGSGFIQRCKNFVLILGALCSDEADVDEDPT